MPSQIQCQIKHILPMPSLCWCRMQVLSLFSQTTIAILSYLVCCKVVLATVGSETLVTSLVQRPGQSGCCLLNAFVVLGQHQGLWGPPEGLQGSSQSLHLRKGLTHSISFSSPTLRPFSCEASSDLLLMIYKRLQSWQQLTTTLRQLGRIITVLRQPSGGSQLRDDSKAVWRWRAEQAVGSQKGDWLTIDIIFKAPWEGVRRAPDTPEMVLKEHGSPLAQRWCWGNVRQKLEKILKSEESSTRSFVGLSQT